MRYFVEISYNGSSFCGWQIQPNGLSVQGALEQALSCRLREPVSVVGAGRTDAGVHALRFFAHFDSKRKDLHQNRLLLHHLNRMLPKHVRVKAIFSVPPHAHARFDALSRTYVYRIARVKDPFTHEYACHIYIPLNMDAMQQAASHLLVYRDFTSFSKLHTDVKTNDCTILEARWEEMGGEWHFTITADRFLRNMVRAIVGTLLEVGKGKMHPDDIRAVIEAKDRGKAGTSAPAHGLYLIDVKYPKEFLL